MDRISISIIAAAVLALSSASLAAQETMDFKPFDANEFQLLLKKELGSKAEGVTVSKAAVFASVSSDIEKAVSSIANTTDYIAEKLCSKKSRPTKITLHLTAGFDLVFSGETGSQIEWDLEVVCPRWEE